MIYMETWRGGAGNKNKKCQMCFLLNKRQLQQHFSAAGRPGRRRQVPADQPKAQECDFSYDGWAELWALIPDWRESRIFRHSEWRPSEKRLGMGKAGRLLRQKGIVCVREGGEDQGDEGGEWYHTFSFFNSRPSPPPPSSTLSHFFLGNCRLKSFSQWETEGMRRAKTCL